MNKLESIEFERLLTSRVYKPLSNTNTYRSYSFSTILLLSTWSSRNIAKSYGDIKQILWYNSNYKIYEFVTLFVNSLIHFVFTKAVCHNDGQLILGVLFILF